MRRTPSAGVQTTVPARSVSMATVCEAHDTRISRAQDSGNARPDAVRSERCRFAAAVWPPEAQPRSAPLSMSSSVA